MPIPSRKKGESKDDFISRFMSNETMKKEFPDHKQRLAIAHSKSNKESIHSFVQGLEVKEDTEVGDLIRGGYIATTHQDTGFLEPLRDIYIKDKIDITTLYAWKDEINEGIPRANKVSVRHDRDEHVTGVGVKDTAKVEKLPDGEYGLYVDTLIDKTKDNFDKTKYRLDKGLLDSFSIEFLTRDPMTNEYMDGAVLEQENQNGIERTLLPGTQLQGWTLASQPMNEHAIMIKELINRTKLREEIKMTEEEPKKGEEEKSEEPKEDPKEDKPEDKQAKPILEIKETTDSISTEDMKILKEAKQKIKAETKEHEYSDIVSRIKEDLKESLKGVKVEEKILITKEDNVEIKEITEYQKMFTEEDKTSVENQFKNAAKIAEKAGLIKETGYVKPSETYAESREFKNFTTNGQKLEFKALGITTNQNTDSNYLLGAAELSDVFDPVIYNALNQKTLTWNILRKEDFSQKGNNQVQFTLKTAANTTAQAYLGNSVFTGNVTRIKYMTQFKKYQVGVEVDGDMIAAARGGPIGDVFAREVQDSTDDLMSVINLALYAEVGTEAAAGVIGFEYITDNGGNGTLYNVSRTSANKLAPTANGDTYINGSSQDISLSNLRKAKRQPIEEGGDLNDLVFFTSPVQGDKFRGIYDAIQRVVPTSSRFGFEGRPEFDGIPIFEDKDCNDDDWFLVDTSTHVVAIWVPPTLEMLGKDSDSQKGFIKTYFATYNRGPRRMVQIYGNKTT